MGLIVNDLCQDLTEMGGSADGLIDWRQRYDGVLMVAYLDGRAVAGVSGPWPVNQYALTWWDRPMPARQLELFDSLGAAQRRVEEWASRLRTIGVIDRPPANDPILPEATVSIVPPPRSSWLGKLRDAIAGTPTPRPQRTAREKLDARRHPPLREVDLRDVHFAAFE